MEILYLYTNNNNLRHILSMNEIMAKDLFETDKYYDSVSTTIKPSGIFLTHKELSDKILKNYTNEIENYYPVVIKINLNYLRDFDVYLITKEFICQEGKGKDYNPDYHIGLLFPFFIPAFMIDSICFRTEEEKARFYSDNFENIFKKAYNYNVDYALFNGNFELDIKQIREKSNNIDLKTDYINIKKRRKLRAGLIGAFGDFKVILNDSAELYFDSIYLELFKVLLNESYNVNEDIEKLKKEIEKNTFVKINWSLLNDKTVLKFVLDSFFEIKEENELFPGFSDDNINENNKIEKKFSIFLAKKIIETGKFSVDNLINCVEEFFYSLNKKNEHLEALKLKYLENFKKINKIISGEINIKYIAYNIKNDYLGLITSLIYAMSMNTNQTAKDLATKLDNHQINPFLKRLSLFFYGMIEGIAGLNQNFKSSHTTLVLSDFLSIKIFYSDLYNKFTLENLKECIYNANQIDLKNKFKEMQKFHTSFGITLAYNFFDWKEKLINKILYLIKVKDRKKEEKVKELIIKNISLTEKYCNKKIVITDLKECEKKDNFLQRKCEIIFNGKHEIINIWRDEKSWQNFKAEIINNRLLILNQNDEELKKLYKEIVKLDD